jgi:hypothetical protein
MELSAAGVPTIALFPWVRDELDVCGIISALNDRERWTCEIVDGLPIPRPCTAVRIAYTTRSGDESSAMGFAPLLAMPTTRRAPLVALGAWAGGRKNPFIKKSGMSELSFLDMPPGEGEDEALQAKRRKESARWTRERLDNPSDDPASYRQVAFCLSTDARATLQLAGVSYRSGDSAVRAQ